MIHPLRNTIQLQSAHLLKDTLVASHQLLLLHHHSPARAGTHEHLRCYSSSSLRSITPAKRPVARETALQSGRGGRLSGEHAKLHQTRHTSTLASSLRRERCGARGRTGSTTSDDATSAYLRVVVFFTTHAFEMVAKTPDEINAPLLQLLLRERIGLIPRNDAHVTETDSVLLWKRVLIADG